MNSNAKSDCYAMLQEGKNNVDLKNVRYFTSKETFSDYYITKKLKVT